MAEEQLCGDTFGQAVQVVGQTHDKVIQRHHPDHAALLDDRHSAERVHRGQRRAATAPLRNRRRPRHCSSPRRPGRRAASADGVPSWTTSRSVTMPIGRWSSMITTAPTADRSMAVAASWMVALAGSVTGALTITSRTFMVPPRCAGCRSAGTTWGRLPVQRGSPERRSVRAEVTDPRAERPRSGVVGSGPQLRRTRSPWEAATAVQPRSPRRRSLRGRRHGPGISLAPWTDEGGSRSGAGGHRRATGLTTRAADEHDLRAGGPDRDKSVGRSGHRKPALGSALPRHWGAYGRAHRCWDRRVRGHRWPRSSGRRRGRPSRRPSWR